MSNKQILIDGVNVAECRFYNYGEGYNSDTEEFFEGACECITAHNEYGEFEYFGVCKGRDCYYKQLKRKEQECEKLRFPMKDTNYALLTKEEFEEYGLLKAENEELTRYKSLFEKTRNLWNEARMNNYKLLDKIKDLKDSLKRTTCQSECYKHKEAEKLKQENDELKTEFDNFEEQIKLQGNFIDSFLNATNNSEWLNKSILEDEADAIIEKVDSDYVQLKKFKQALQEIKEITKQMNNECFYDDFDCKDCDMKKGCTHFNKKQILQKCEVIDK